MRQRTIAYWGCVLASSGMFRCDYGEPSSATTTVGSARATADALLASAGLLEPVKRGCVEAVSRPVPVLLEFSADWCQDCQLLHRLAQTVPLRDELAQWQWLPLDVDEEKHDALAEAFEVRAIARWILLQPTDCDQPPTAWKRLGDRVVEPTRDRSLSSQGLATWLQERRLASR